MAGARHDEVVVAKRVGCAIDLDSEHPAAVWKSAAPISFCNDWQGKNPDLARETEVRVLWSPEVLYLRFVCHYREIFVFEDADSKGRRDHLWERDAVEVFLQPPDAFAESGATRPTSSGRFYACYKELEIAPNGSWIDLDISPTGAADLKSGLKRSVYLDPVSKCWIAEMAVPMVALTSSFSPVAAWRVNFYRIEGRIEPRAYLAWRPTRSPEPDFHVPEAFGTLQFDS